MEMLSLWVSLVLGLISILTLFTFHQAAGAPKVFAAIAVDRMDLHLLTVIHVVRAPAQVVLYCLFLFKALPLNVMPGEWSLNICFGLTAPFVYYWGVMTGEVKWRLLLIWNVAGLVLLLAGIVENALVFPEMLNRFVLEQQLSVAYLPFVFVPVVIVPVLLCSHFVVIRKLLKANSEAFKSWPAFRSIHFSFK
jgi:hypothetical protein